MVSIPSIRSASNPNARNPVNLAATDRRSSNRNTPTRHADTLFAGNSCLQYMLNAVSNPDLLQRNGQYQTAHRIVDELAKRSTPMPQEMKFEVTVPEERWLKELEKGLQKLNNVVQPSSWWAQVKQTAFRYRTGLQGPLPTVKYERDTQEPNRKMNLTVNLTGVHQDDVVKFASFLHGRISK